MKGFILGMIFFLDLNDSPNSGYEQDFSISDTPYISSENVESLNNIESSNNDIFFEQNSPSHLSEWSSDNPNDISPLPDSDNESDSGDLDSSYVIYDREETN